MAQTDLTIQIDDELKASGEALIFKLGVSWSTAMNALLKQAVERGKLPFDIEGIDDPLFDRETYEMDSYYDREMQANLRKQLAEIESGQAELIDYDTAKNRRF